MYRIDYGSPHYYCYLTFILIQVRVLLCINYDLTLTILIPFFRIDGSLNYAFKKKVRVDYGSLPLLLLSNVHINTGKGIALY